LRRLRGEDGRLEEQPNLSVSLKILSESGEEDEEREGR
jgi:hypothetical protein